MPVAQSPLTAPTSFSYAHLPTPMPGVHTRVPSSSLIRVPVVLSHLPLPTASLHARVSSLSSIRVPVVSACSVQSVASACSVHELSEHAGA
eukprot:3407478-Pyramimonas_sp.AAC.1